VGVEVSATFPPTVVCRVCGKPDVDGVGECGDCFTDDDTAARRRADV
jgi:hypothetical protein